MFHFGSKFGFALAGSIVVGVRVIPRPLVPCFHWIPGFGRNHVAKYGVLPVPVIIDIIVGELKDQWPVGFDAPYQNLTRLEHSVLSRHHGHSAVALVSNGELAITFPNVLVPLVVSATVFERRAWSERVVCAVVARVVQLDFDAILRGDNIAPSST